MYVPIQLNTRGSLATVYLPAKYLLNFEMLAHYTQTKGKNIEFIQTFGHHKSCFLPVLRLDFYYSLPVTILAKCRVLNNCEPDKVSRMSSTLGSV